MNQQHFTIDVRNVNFLRILMKKKWKINSNLQKTAQDTKKTEKKTKKIVRKIIYIL